MIKLKMTMKAWGDDDDHLQSFWWEPQMKPRFWEEVGAAEAFVRIPYTFCVNLPVLLYLEIWNLPLGPRIWLSLVRCSGVVSCVKKIWI